MKSLRKNKLPVRHTHESKQKIDTWLSRASHLSQVGLLAVTVFIYLYTVVPIYEKDKLDKEIANKEKELAITKLELERNYSLFKRDLIRGYIFSAGAGCSGILHPPVLPPRPNEKSKSFMEHLAENFEIDITDCLTTKFDKSSALRKMRPSDYKSLAKRIKTLTVELEVKKAKRIDEFNEYTEKVISNPNLLPELEADSFTGRTLARLKGKIPPNDYELQLFKARVDQGLQTIIERYRSDMYKDLQSLVHEVNAPS